MSIGSDLSNDLLEQSRRATNPNVQALLLTAAAKAKQGDLRGMSKALAEVKQVKATNQDARADARKAKRQAGRGPGVPAGYPGAEEDGLGDDGFWDEDPTDYVSMFREQLGAARANVEAQLSAALGDIAKSESASGALLDRAPADLSALYGQATANTQQFIDTSAKSAQAAGLGQFVDPAGQMAPFQAALQGEQTARMADLDYLKIGLAQAFANQRSQAHQAHMGSMADIASQESGAMLDAIESERERQFRAKQAVWEASQQDAEDAGTASWGRRDISWDRGMQVADAAANPDLAKQYGVNPALYDDIRSGGGGRQKTYNQATKFLDRRNVQSAGDLNKALRAMQRKKKFQKRPRAASAAIYDSGLVPLYVPQG